LPDDSSKDTVRRAYIELVKEYHPDTTKHPSEKFSEIDGAYRSLQIKFRDDKLRDENSSGEYGLYYQEKTELEEDEEKVEHPDIEHTAPQHRQYLENEGFGHGTPSQRQNQHQKYKAFRANQAVFEHRMSKLAAQHEDRVVTRERRTVKKHTTRSQIDRVVEDLIQESMADGQFDNLAGKGQPLPDRVDYNPYADFTTHKMNQILVEGGFAPEWVRLRVDIRDQFDVLRAELRRVRQTLGPGPLNQTKLDKWNAFYTRLERHQVTDLNRRIDKFNLIVPMLNGQMFHFNLEAEARDIMESGFDPNIEAELTKEKKNSNSSAVQQKGIIQEIIEKLFKTS